MHEQGDFPCQRRLSLFSECGRLLSRRRYFAANGAQHSGSVLPDVIYGETAIVDKDRHFLHMRRLSTPKKLDWKSFKQGMLVCHQAFFARHTLMEPYDLNYRYSADFDWCIRIMKKARTLHNTHLTIIDYLDEGMTTQTGRLLLKNGSALWQNIMDG